MSAYLLLHGAWHGAWCWEPLSARLCGAGHRVVAPDLPGLSAETVHAAGRFGLGDHIQAGLAALDRMEGEVILVAHSYAGMVARAIESLRPGRLAHICYIEALQPKAGEAAIDLVPDRGVAFRPSVRDTAYGPILLPPDVSRFAIPDERMAREIAARLLPQPWRTFTDPLPAPAAPASRGIPRTYVFASDRDPNPYQACIDRLRAEGTTRIVGLSGGHELMLTRTDALADLLLDIAATCSRPAPARSPTEETSNVHSTSGA